MEQVVIGRLDPFGNNSCEVRTDLFNESMFGRYNVTYTLMVSLQHFVVVFGKRALILNFLKFSNIASYTNNVFELDGIPLM